MNNEVYEQVDDLKRIKKEYGENMSHMCRELFPTILETPGLLYHIITTHFAKSKYLCEDIINENEKYVFKNYIYSLYDKMNIGASRIEEPKSVRELLMEKGYTLYECKTNEDIQKFSRYYTDKEKLCTFHDPNRINSHYIFFIVKEDADKLNRSSFTSPKREDEYSVSVLDLQFDKGEKQRVSIKSRYNHTVRNPDATYSNNLENIAEGLTEAFEKDYEFNIGNEYKVNFELDHYVLAEDNKYYKYNYEINNIHYCPNNIIINNGKVINTYSDKSRYTFLDYFILDEMEKRIITYDAKEEDSFIDDLSNITNIQIKNEEGHKKITLKLEDNKEAIIILDTKGRIIGYENKYLQECGNNFLHCNNTIKYLNLPSLQECGDNFLQQNQDLATLNLPSLQECGENFLYYNQNLETLNLPSLQECGENFLGFNNNLKALKLPCLQVCGNNFLGSNDILQALSLPSLEECGSFFLEWNGKIQFLDMPNLKRCNHNFLYRNESLITLKLPSLQECGFGFLSDNNSLQILELPNLLKSGSDFLSKNKNLRTIYLPNLEECGNNFLRENEYLENLELPNLLKCGSDFLSKNKNLQALYLPNLQECGNNFLFKNEYLEHLELPNLLKCGSRFLYNNKSLKTLYLQSLQENYYKYVVGKNDSRIGGIKK